MKQLVIEESASIRKKVYHYIREQILSGILAPDERLVETKIAREIGASRTPVREALHSLELEKLVRSIPRVGYVVAGMSESEVEQICEIRSNIEGLAARWAIEKAHKKLLGALLKNMTNQEASVARGDLGAYVELDAQFHEILARLSGSERLFELAQTLRRHMLRYRIQCIYETDVALRSMEGHKNIINAIKDIDIEGTAKAIRDHLEQAKKDILYCVFKEAHEHQA